MADARRRRNVCILGATSAMAEHTARRLAAKGDALALVARDRARLEAMAGDLRTRGATVVTLAVPDLSTLERPDDLLGEAEAALGALDTILVFHGYLGDQARAETDLGELRRIWAVNATSAVELLVAGAARLKTSSHPRPVLLVVGSVAGDRGRMSNYVYGAAKAAVAATVQGLAQSFAQQGSRARAIVVKPGLTDTPMTVDLPKGGPLWSSADQVAAVIVAALERGGPVVYAPWFWRWIMLIIRLLPQAVINRTRI
jgi:decaprenylphospho-beta-D-erythro-pentofuranosid-2-ulose 2-reductase